MQTDEETVFSLSVVVRTGPAGAAARATTYSTVQGRYGSIGSVSIPTEHVRPPTSLQEVARLLLTALYGLDYDL